MLCMRIMSLYQVFRRAWIKDFFIRQLHDDISNTCISQILVHTEVTDLTSTKLLACPTLGPTPLGCEVGQI